MIKDAQFVVDDTHGGRHIHETVILAVTMVLMAAVYGDQHTLTSADSPDAL